MKGAAALNLNFFQTLRLIIIPQVYKYSIAPTVSFLIQIIKGTSLAYIIGFQDLMLLGKRWANAPVIGSEPFIIFPIMAVLYFCLCYPLAIYAKHLEKNTPLKFNKLKGTIMLSKKMIYGFISSLFLMSFSVNADLNEILKSGEVKIAVPEAFAPFGSVGKTGEHEGYDVDVAKLIAKDLGVKLKIVPVVSKKNSISLKQTKLT